MVKFLEIARTGLTSILLHPIRSLVTVAAVLAVLVPYLVGLGVSLGIQAEAETSIAFGADVYVSGTRFGQAVPIGLDTKAEIEKIDGVTEVVPRIIGAMVPRGTTENAVLVGLPPGKFPKLADFVDGRFPGPSPRNELVMGSELARRLNLKVGQILPPIYHNVKGDRLSEVVGIFRGDAPLWQARLILTSLETAMTMFNQEALVTDFLVYCRPGYQNHVRLKVMEKLYFAKEGHGVRPAVITRDDLLALMPSALRGPSGIFTVHFILAFAVGILAVLVTSGFGLSERRREIGILKATGWQTDQILLRSGVENFLLTLVSASLAIILAFVWLRGFNGYWIAGVFLSGAGTAPSFQVPFHLAPVPATISVLLAFAVVMIGSISSTWRAAKAAPVEAMR